MFTTAQVADQLGKCPSHIRRLSIRHEIGVKVSDRVRIFGETDVDAIRAHLVGGKMGRPKGSKTGGAR